MPTQLVFVPPSGFVDELTVTGLPTIGGPVTLNRYVSTYRRSPLAAAVGNQLAAVASGSLAVGGGQAGAVAALRRLHRDVVSGPGPQRETNWRHVFSGHGHPTHLQAVWNFILGYRGFLETLPPLHAATDARIRDAPPARNFTWAGWYVTGNPLPAMVRDGVFGYDCLGLVGNYLARAGLEPHCSERSVAQYLTLRSLQPVRELSQVRPLCLLLWQGSDTATQHIAIVDRVHGPGADDRGRPVLVVDVSQCSGPGPQTNRRASIAPVGGATVGDLPAFHFVHRGTPAAPVMGHFGLKQNPDWQLVAN